MKRQNSFLSSSSQIEISSDNLRRSKSFGCVSGLLHFLSNNQSRRNKSITFVHNNNQELHDAISETKSSPIRIVPQNASSDSRRISGQIPELERSESLISTEENFRGARGPIVRLMGLESCA
ncbi:uncharacterized protein LOC111021569, partial [Momordica charantia]|uniref:Uncharacterized protein LOC111021569 n=1 Tax=Momordica charantia TaxID=3673 RepID=A0A6J1DLL1_MOMCH